MLTFWAAPVHKHKETGFGKTKHNQANGEQARKKRQQPNAAEKLGLFLVF